MAGEPLIVAITAISGIISCGLLSASLGTDYWATADITDPYDEPLAINGTVNIGLFTGSYKRFYLGQENNYPLTAVCVITEGVCMWSCLDNADARYYELENLVQYGYGGVSFKCDRQNDNATRILRPKDRGVDKIPKVYFMPPSHLICTLAFISIAELLNILAAVVGLINILYRPSQWYLSYVGMYLYHRLAATTIIITIGFWAYTYGAHLQTNIAIFDTLVSTRPKTSATVGYSFALMVLSIIGNGFYLFMIYCMNWNTPKEEIPLHGIPS